jgi:hypothetical protein
MVDLVCVLSLGKLAIQQGDILVGLVLEHLHALSASCLVLTGFSHRIQLSNLRNINNLKDCQTGLDLHKNCMVE